MDASHPAAKSASTRGSWWRWPAHRAPTPRAIRGFAPTIAARPAAHAPGHHGSDFYGRFSGTDTTPHLWGDGERLVERWESAPGVGEDDPAGLRRNCDVVHPGHHVVGVCVRHVVNSAAVYRGPGVDGLRQHQLGKHHHHHHHRHQPPSGQMQRSVHSRTPRTAMTLQRAHAA